MISVPSSIAAARAALSLAVLLLATPAAAAPMFNITGMTPDLSQHADPQWTNYCAPTAGADVVYFFSNSFGSLQPPSGFGPGAANDAEATDMIGPLPAVINPMPPPLSLAGRMVTDLANGTTPANLAMGLDGYLEDNDGIAGPFWDTQVLFGAAIGGQSLWDTSRNELEQGAGVILLVDWASAGSPPPGENEEQRYDVPAEPGTGLNSPLAHAVTLVGFDISDPLIPALFFHDPGNNLSVGHTWPAEGLGADTSNVTVTANDFRISISGTTAAVYGAVITQPVPQPSTALLVAVGLVVLAAGRRRLTG